MGRMKNIEHNVRAVLEKYPESRGNDFVLYAMYIKENTPELATVGLIYALLEAQRLGMPSYESVTRARRKIQQFNEDLRPPEKSAKARQAKIAEFKKYAKM